MYITNKDNIIVKCKNIVEPIALVVSGVDIFNLDNQCEANTDDSTLLISKRELPLKYIMILFHN